MSEFIEIHWTAGSIDEARRVCRYLVQERLVACAQIIPWIESVYMWNNQLETSQESKVAMKTSADLFETIKEVIQKNSSYDVPEIICIKIEKGNQDYMDWLGESVSVSV
ncbi:Divalent-cation tolerance protein CutA [Waddlia chondrophila 2032/99]|uniref:Divalent-cation tolerance protein CutA n=2 Tax=Waddlia chondrophila TaxID=71667 RepID=F8LC53_9BACT|nr:divalent-cation tolerance protein CutA [Waddlia chondrophila]ADI38734.1 putative divalent-cation tolerance protein [Waddlia chondrophila WSU 86-1044]CCB91067.1 Divalent-cation tolerance protein CutA [Waddlia chondrophila 2032/99]